MFAANIRDMGHEEYLAALRRHTEATREQTEVLLELVAVMRKILADETCAVCREEQ